MEHLLESQPERVAAQLRADGIERAWLAPDAEVQGAWRASHAELGGVAEFLGRCPDQRGHEAVFLAVGPRSGALLAVFLHRLDRGQGQGGLRRLPYASLEALLRDGLRLSWGMGRKNALAGLWWGGGKGILASSADTAEDDAAARRPAYLDFGDFVSSLAGCYVTAEDAGTRPEDVAHVFERTRFVTCVPEAFGGSGNPSFATARGVLAAIEAALRWQGRELAGARVVVQGAGNVGAALVDRLLERGAAKVLVGEAEAARRHELADRWDGAPVELRPVEDEVAEGRLLREACDVLAPCALGSVLGPANIPELKTGLVCGAANNPLQDEHRDAEALRARGILYVPDYVANRMGIVHCANEHLGRLDPDPEIESHLARDNPRGIPAVVEAVLREAERRGVATTRAAEQMAEELTHEPHPLHGRRARAIVASLLTGAWCRPSAGPDRARG